MVGLVSVITAYTLYIEWGGKFVGGQMEKTMEIRRLTKIEAQKRAGRYNLYLDGKYAFPVAESVLVRFQLRKGMEVDAALAGQLQAADQVARAYSRMLDYLTHQRRTEHELVQKLREMEIPEGVVAPVMARLVREGLVDDRAYAAAYVRTAIATSLKGPQVIREKLRLKRVAPELIEEGLAQFTPDQQAANALKAAQNLARRYAKLPPRRQEERIRQGLLTQGYDGAVYQAIKDQLTPPEVDPDEQDARLDHEATKVWHHYQREAPAKRRLKVKQALWRKGYELDAVEEWLVEREE